MGIDLDRRRPVSSPATPTKEDAVEWVPLRKHPFFTSTSAVSMAAGVDLSASSAQKPGNLSAWDSVASRLYVWDCEKFGLHRLSVSFGDDDDHVHPHDPASILAATPWKMFRPDIPLQFTVHNISINRAGTSVVLSGSGGLCVMYLYKRNSRKDGSIVCNTVSVGSQLYLDENNFVQTLQASWHPHSDTHLVVLSSDSVFRLFDLSFDIEKAEQEFYLQPVEHGFGNNAGSICPVAFFFSGEHLWDRFSIHTKRRNRLEQKRLNDLVYVRYNQILHPISLKDIDESNDWLTGMMDSLDLDKGGDDTAAPAPDLVFSGEELDWAIVTEAMGVDEPRARTRAKGKAPASTSTGTTTNVYQRRGQARLAQVGEEEEEDDEEEEEFVGDDDSDSDDYHEEEATYDIDSE